MLQTEEVTDIKSLDPYLDEWGQLVDSCDDAGLLDTPEWLLTCLRSFWSDKRLAFLFVRDDGVLRAALPLIEDECRGPLHRPGLILPIHNQVRRANLVTTFDVDATLDAILEHLRGEKRGRRLTAHVVTDTSIARFLPSAASAHGMATTVRTSPASPYVDLPADWDEYLAGRDRKARKELRRKRNRIEKEPGFEARVVRDEKDVEAGIADLFAIEDNSWKATHGETMTETEELRGFYSELAYRCAARGWLRLQLLYIDGRPVAHLFGVAYKNELSALKTSYDNEFRNLSPGIIVVTEAMQQAIAEGVRRFDLLGGEARWKTELATGEREHAYYCFFPKHSIVCRTCGLYHHHAKPFIKERMPALVNLKRRLRGELSA